MKSRRLLFIINVDWYFNLHWLARAEAAKAEGFDVHIAAHFTDSTMRHRLEQQGFSTHPLLLHRKSMNPFKDLATKRQISRLIKHVNPVLVHSITVKPNIYAGAVCKRLGVKQVMSVTGLGLAFSSNKLKARLSRKVMTSFYRHAAKNDQLRIIFENSDDEQCFKVEGIGKTGERVVIAGAGVDLSFFKYQVEVEPEVPVILFAARMLWDKGIGDLIRACEILKGRGVEVRLDVAGIIDHESQSAIPESQILEWHNNGNLNWLGQVDDMVKCIGESTLVALPTTYGEGVPRVLIEAAAIGRPIVATNVTGCRDIVQHEKTGFLVSPGSPSEIADKIELLVRDKVLRRKFGLSGRKLVEDVFSQKMVIEKTLEVYSSLLKTH